MSFTVTRIAPAPWENFTAQASFQDRMAELKESRRRALIANPRKPTVVISGGGPAGLCRAISALVNGNPVKVVEKRAAEDSTRENTVLLEGDSIELLKYYGVYSLLIENGFVFAPSNDKMSVRLKDLEQTMKVVLSALTTEPVIHHGSKIEQIVSRPGAKADIVIKDSAGQRTQINSVDLLVVAEGAHSHTNQTLLGNRRITVLPPLPVIAAIFKEDRHAVSSIPTFFYFIGKTLLNTATSVYYYTIFLFKFIVQRQHFFSPNRQIAGALVLNTPGQNYLGAGLSKLETEKMVVLCKKWKEATAALESARQNNAAPEEIARLSKELIKAHDARESYLHYWAKVSYCCANALKIAAFIYAREPIHFASWLPIDNVQVAEIGADKSSAYSGTVEGTAYLIAGDTLATVDPVTGLGCNTALKTTLDFHRVLNGLERGEPVRNLLNDYNSNSEVVVMTNHAISKRRRQDYRPDAVGA